MQMLETALVAKKMKEWRKSDSKCRLRMNLIRKRLCSYMEEMDKKGFVNDQFWLIMKRLEVGLESPQIMQPLCPFFLALWRTLLMICP